MIRSLCAAAVAFCLSLPSAGAVTVETIYKFNGADGRGPQGLVSVDANGVLYGTTSQGGAENVGTVFRLAPPTPGRTQWTLQTLHVFRGAPDGKFPFGGVTLGPDGSLVGAALGGPLGGGTIYRLTPPAPNRTAWAYQTIHTFDPKASEGAPLAPVRVLPGGSILIGSSGCGAIFRLLPPQKGATTWTRKDLANAKTLGVCRDFGRSPLVLYGNGEIVAASKDGALLRLTPPKVPAQPWQITTTSAGAILEYPILCCHDGAGRIFGIEGYLGTGRVYALDPPANPAGPWTATFLQTLDGIWIDKLPHALVRSGRSLYGVTGLYSDAGTLYRLDPPDAADGAWTRTTLVSFGSGAAVGADPTSLTLGPNGVLYGTTTAGGNNTNGTIFRVVP